MVYRSALPFRFFLPTAEGPPAAGARVACGLRRAAAIAAGVLGCMLLASVTAPAAMAQSTDAASASPSNADDPVAIVIHGGAGTIRRADMSAEQDSMYRAALNRALSAGHDVLTDGGAAVDAVVAAITTMEDDSLFNAAKGAVFTSENTVELDASIMDGETRQAGALTGVKHIRNPIELARTIMNESVHVMLAQEGAETFARQQGFDMVENEYFYTERRQRAAEKARENGPTGDASLPDSYDPETAEDAGGRGKFGTVGAVALDQDGNIAAGTSTGGTTNKRFGRIGDSPIIGAGTYADNETCGVSATGHGEYFIRAAAAHSVAARMKFAGMSVEEAARVTVMDELPAMPPNGGSGGVIALDAEGNIAMPFNTQGMYRGYVDTDGNRAVMIYEDE